jgi:hypothetical protein
MTGYMINAERKCGKSTKNRRHHYSPKLVKAGQTVTALKKKRTAIEVKLTRSTDEEKAELRGQIPQLNEQLKQAWIKLKEVQADSRVHRDAFLQEQGKMYAEQNNTDASKAVEIIIRCEKTKRIYSKIKRYLKPNNSEPLDRILTPDGNDAWNEITNSNQIFEKLTQQAIIEMSGPGTDNTPFTTLPLSNVIPPWSPSKHSEEILNGTYKPPESCKNEARELIRELTYKDGKANHRPYRHC